MKDGNHQNAEEFLALYLDALDDELAELHTSIISTHKLVSTSSAGEIEESVKPEGQAEVGERDYTVRHSIFHSLHYCLLRCE